MDDHRLERYDYDLPPARVAQRPLEARDASRLMLLRGDAPPVHHVFRDLPGLLAPGDVLVRNDTRVIPARLRGRRAGGGRTELLLVHPVVPDASASVPPDAEATSFCGEAFADTWLCLARPASHLKPGKVVTFGEETLTAEILDRREAGKVVARFATADGTPFRDALERLGEVPLPPYIERVRGSGPDADDRERYQTVYARREGAVAAPTAGLHFTDAVEADLRARGVGTATLTLHVGPGTFRPILVESLEAHRMDAEYYEVPTETADRLNAARRAGGRVLAVGTTSVRALESASAPDGTIAPGRGWTELFIRPGYAFRAVDGLLTNFHLPRSSLLVLVAALAGRDRVLAAYAEAVAAGYRFYSYGDAMLLLPGEGGEGDA